VYIDNILKTENYRRVSKFTMISWQIQKQICLIMLYLSGFQGN